MGRLTRIIFEYLLAFVLITLLLFAIASVVVVKFYGDDLQSFVIKEVNSNLDSKVYVAEVDIKIFHKFPNTSIVLNEITVWSSHNFNTYDFQEGGADTLLTAETVNVSFNLFNLIRKKYNIRQLEIKNGALHLFTDRAGEVNYHLLVKDSPDGKAEQQINMAQLKVSNFHILLNNKVKQLKASGILEQLDLNGKFSKKTTQIKGSLKGALVEISNNKILYASDREIRAKLNLIVTDSLYTIKTGQLQIDRIIADVDGRLNVNPGSGVYMDLYATARDLNIHEILDLLPKELSSPLKKIEGNGILQLYTRVTGMASSTLTPRVEADFQTSNANLRWDRLPFAVKNLNLTGSYSNGGEFNPLTTSLNIESISAVIGDDHISGRGQISNFYEPYYSFEVEGNLHPSQWIKWYGSIPIDDAEGTIVSDIKVTGSYDRLKSPGDKFISFDISGDIGLKDLMIKVTKKSPPFSGLNGTIHINNDFWEPAISGNYGASDFTISGSGLNLLSFLLDHNQDLVASATLRSNRLDLQEVLDNLPRSNASRNGPIHFPEKLKLKLDFVINEFSKDRLRAEKVRGIAQYDSPLLYIDSLYMQTMEGTIKGRFGMTQDHEGNISTNVTASLYNLDIHQLFHAFNNFGQSQLTHEHLKGTVSGSSAFSASFDSTFTIRTKTILSENEVIIQDGELIGFSPIMALSRFIEVEELRNIQFETLENTILIKENQVIIPVMDIQSNALNLTASGSHGFDNHYDYRIKLLLSELLYNKARRSRNSEFDVAADESDKRTLFLKIYDQGAGVNVEVDREKAATKIRNDLKKEKTELKSILNEELGLFRTDEEVIEYKKKQDEEKEIFIFDFSDEPDSLADPNRVEEKNRWWKKRAKKETLQIKPAKEFVIDE